MHDANHHFCTKETCQQQGHIVQRTWATKQWIEEVSSCQWITGFTSHLIAIIKRCAPLVVSTSIFPPCRELLRGNGPEMKRNFCEVSFRNRTTSNPSQCAKGVAQIPQCCWDIRICATPLALCDGFWRCPVPRRNITKLRFISGPFPLSNSRHGGKMGIDTASGAQRSMTAIRYDVKPVTPLKRWSKTQNPLLHATTCDCHERMFCCVGISSTGPWHHGEVGYQHKRVS